MNREQESHSQEQDGAIARSGTELEPEAGQNHNREEPDRALAGSRTEAEPESGRILRRGQDKKRFIPRAEYAKIIKRCRS